MVVKDLLMIWVNYVHSLFGARPDYNVVSCVYPAVNAQAKLLYKIYLFVHTTKNPTVISSKLRINSWRREIAKCQLKSYKQK